MNITEDYVSYEVAKLLKEKGFEGDINAYYHIWDSGNNVCSVQEFNSSEAPHLYIPAPTHQMAMKWLREVHIHIIIDYREVSYKYFFRISYCYNSSENLDFYDSYEDAVEAALKYSLENLIL